MSCSVLGKFASLTLAHGLCKQRHVLTARLGFDQAVVKPLHGPVPVRGVGGSGSAATEQDPAHIDQGGVQGCLGKNGMAEHGLWRGGGRWR